MREFGFIELIDEDLIAVAGEEAGSSIRMA